MYKNTLFLTACSLGILAISCNKNDDDKIPQYTVPDSYATFDNVEFAEATMAVNMGAGFTGYLGKGSTRQLSQDTVNFLWNNTGNAFTSEFTPSLPNTAAQMNTSGFGIASKTADAIIFKTLADSMVKISAFYNTPGSQGVAGKQGGTRLFNYSGFEFNQGVLKGLFGGLQLGKVNQHLDASKTADNNTVVAGKGTAMQHEW